MPACLPLFQDGVCALVGDTIGGVGHPYVGPVAGNYNNNGYDGIGGCSGGSAISQASLGMYIGTTAAWDSGTKTGFIAVLGTEGTVSITISTTIISDLGPGIHAIKIKMAQGIFSTDPAGGSRPSPGDGTLQIGPVCPGDYVMVISPPSVPNGAVGVAYDSQQLSTANAVGTPVYALGGGSLPPGITISSGGLLSGTPTTPGRYEFTITVTDDNTCAQASADFVILVPTVDGACP